MWQRDVRSKKEKSERERKQIETIWRVMLPAGQILGRRSAVLLWQNAFLTTQESRARAVSLV